MPDAAQPLDAALAAARADARRFFEALPRAARVVVFCHFDADGLAAGAVAGRALPRMGFADARVVPSGRGESAFGDAARARLAALAPDALVVTDLGVKAAGVLPGVPTLYVDHHLPDGLPTDDAVVASGYAWDPVPTSAWLMWELLAPLAAEAGAPIDDLLWVAAVGALSDLGDKAPWERLPAVRKAYTAKWLKEAVSLVNAARRGERVRRRDAVRHAADGGRPARGERGRGGRRRPAARLPHRGERGARGGPQTGADFAAGDSPWAMVPVASPCQIHPLIAQQWRGRLPRHAVMGANAAYLPGVVAFSSRTSRRDLSLPRLLRAAVDLGPLNADFGNGHDQASGGGHLPPEPFDRLLAALGFDARARTAAPGG